MKKFFGFFFMLSLFAGCAKEAPVNTNTSTPKDEVPAETKQVVTLFADVEQFTSESGATPQSKAIADDGFSWQEGDQIAIPATGVSGGYAIFTYDTEKGKFVYELTGSESFVDGTAYYPANSRPEGGYSSDFANADAARKGFKMTAEYTAGANSIAFHHTGAMVELHFTNVPSFATTVRVKIGEATAATVALSSPTSTVTVKVPVPAASSSTYSFALLQGENIIREVSKSATLYAGKYYDTPEIAIKVINVGVIYYIVENWGLSAGWKLYYGGGESGDQTVDLINLNTTTKQAVGSSYWGDTPQTFYMYYAAVPSDITQFKVFWTNGTSTDWYGNNCENPDNNYAFVFEYDSNKNAVYMEL